jgi:cytochrome P450
MSDDAYAFNPFDPNETQHMWDLMARMRAECPVSRPVEGFAYVARYADNVEVFRDAKRFSSAEGFRGAGVVVPEEESFLGEMDPPAHPRIRRLLIKAFSLQQANATEAWTRARVRTMIDTVVADGGGDLVHALAVPLPGAVAAHALGIPDEHHDQVARWCHELLHSTWPQTNATERGAGIAGGFPEFAALLDHLVAERRAAGAAAPDDLLTRMVQLEGADGFRLSDVFVRTLAVNTLAGSLSTTYLLGNLMYRFVTEPQSFTHVLRADPAKIPVAVEESLRVEPPVLFLFRTATSATTVGGCPVAAGERLITGIASANRDESVYERADEFRLDRPPGEPEHLAFGVGPHICLGNHLTRVEARVVLEELLARFGPDGPHGLHLAPGYQKTLVPMFLEYGPATLDVVVTS